MVVLGGDHGRIAQRLQALQVVDHAPAKLRPRLHLLCIRRRCPIVARQLHAVGGLSAHTDAGVVACVSLAHNRPFGIHQIAVHCQAAQAGGRILHIGGIGADLRIAGVEAAGLHNAPLPLRAIDLERNQRADG